jgi:Tol biopolymer transport system component
MVTFIRGGEFFQSRGQIYVKLLPNGEPVRLTNTPDMKYGPVFTPDGTRVAYTQLSDRTGSMTYDTWIVSAFGGQPTQFLPNASGLTWLSDERLLFAEIKTGLHMGIVTATQSRAERREIYFPAHERAMAHYAYASPDRKSVLLVEMDRTAVWQPCRVVPFDGSSAGRQVGPPGRCTAAAWSPDGAWMYFTATVEGGSHLWRQASQDGTPEQITLGPTEEEGIAMAPDGLSLVTSVGTYRSAIWLHDAAGERPISSEGYTRLPRLSRDGRRVFYVLQQDSTDSSAELRAHNLASGEVDRLVPGFSVVDYDISRDEKEVAFTTTERDGKSTIWLASLDRGSAPRVLTQGGDRVSFGGNGELIFRLLEEKANFLGRINKDGTGRTRISDSPILNMSSVSPDGESVIAFAPVTRENASTQTGTNATFAFPVNGGTQRKLCSVNCFASWSFDSMIFYVSMNEKTLAIPVPAGKMLPDLPASGLGSNVGVVDVPDMRVIHQGNLLPGPNSSTYVFQKTERQRNLFRVSLP